jgi:hypothetical protein
LTIRPPQRLPSRRRQADPAVATKSPAELNALVPRGLQVAAAWSWRMILVVALLWGIVWLARYLSEVLIPVAVAILLTALMLPVANALKKGDGVAESGGDGDYRDWVRSPRLSGC